MYKKIKKFKLGGGTGQSLPNPNSSFSPNLASITAQQNLQFSTPDIGSMASNQFSNFSSNITGYSNVPQTITSESGFTRPDMSNMNLQQMQAATTPSLDSNQDLIYRIMPLLMLLINQEILLAQKALLII